MAHIFTEIRRNQRNVEKKWAKKKWSAIDVKIKSGKSYQYINQINKYFDKITINVW